MEKFIEISLPPLSDQDFWAKELYNTLCKGKPKIKLLKSATCKRLAKEIATGTRTIINPEYIKKINSQP